MCRCGFVGDARSGFGIYRSVAAVEEDGGVRFRNRWDGLRGMEESVRN